MGSYDYQTYQTLLRIEQLLTDLKSISSETLSWISDYIVPILFFSLLLFIMYKGLKRVFLLD